MSYLICQCVLEGASGKVLTPGFPTADKAADWAFSCSDNVLSTLAGYNLGQFPWNHPFDACFSNIGCGPSQPSSAFFYNGIVSWKKWEMCQGLVKLISEQSKWLKIVLLYLFLRDHPHFLSLKGPWLEPLQSVHIIVCIYTHTCSTGLLVFIQTTDMLWSLVFNTSGHLFSLVGQSFKFTKALKGGNSVSGK